MRDFARDVLDAALATGGDFAEIFWEDHRTNSLQMVGGRVEIINSGRIHGAGIRVFVGLNAIYAYTNDTDREGLLRCAHCNAAMTPASSRPVIQLCGSCRASSSSCASSVGRRLGVGCGLGRLASRLTAATTLGDSTRWRARARPSTAARSTARS